MASPHWKDLEIVLLEPSHCKLLSAESSSCLKEIASNDGNLLLCVKSIIDGDYEQVLLGEVAMAILGSGEDDIGDASDVVDFIQKKVEAFIQKSQTKDDNSRELCVLCVGVACLQLFIQSNWTGPPCKVNPTDVLPRSLSQDAKTFHDSTMSTLSPDDSAIYSLVTHPEFLLISTAILNRCKASLATCVTSDWWNLRCLWIHQQCLDEKSPMLHEEIHTLMDSISSNEALMNGKQYVDLCVIHHLECSHICQYYYEYTRGKEHLNTAKKVAGLEVNLTAALGKRTRFQQTDKAQLFLRVRHEDSGETPAAQTKHQLVKGLPVDLNLNDETVLDAINFKDADVNQLPELSSAEQALVLALCIREKKSRPREVLILEELKAYIVAVLRQPQVWGIHTLALMTRCQLEKDAGRTVERAMMQMQSLVDQFNGLECAVTDRMELLHAVGLPPKWTMESELASLLMSLGVVTAALEVYVRLELWEEVIKCYTLLEKPDKATKIIRDQLAIKETPTLWCMMGDFKKEKKFYEKAWELSGQRNARAMRSLGLYYLEEEEWEKSIECLEMSLKKNPLQYNAWFWLGYSANKAENYEIALRAYRKCVTLESDNGKAWNNLSSALLNLKQKPKAFKTLQEAIRCLYDSWQIWENYMLVGVDIGEFKESMRAFHRLLEIKEKYVDEEVLAIMVRAVTQDLPDADGNPSSAIKGKLVELFGRVTANVTTNAKVWKLYAQLHGNTLTDLPESNDKALQCLQKAHRLNTQSQEWSKDVKSCKDTVEESIQLAQAYETCSKSKVNNGEAAQLLSSAKLMLKSIISKAKKEHSEGSSTQAELSDPLASAESELQTVVELIQQRKE
ncbi:tetratricopeptide repeat protein 27-like [Asterias rubens]|uniref:tetratricopeptide repeat protein 27-like n=1 Tax=Asterias rubens TaxID=7604 RepID=UPI00145593FF|nr:tetratricopeptide repeat protein 27-like [Asterias rubens]